MDAKKYSSELRHLVEEYMVAVELRQHNRVSQLSLIIRRSLIELLDDDLNDVESSGCSPNEAFPLEISIIEAICRKLRDQGHIAAIYENVVEFVQLRDLVCLSRLLGAVADKDVSKHDSNVFDFDLMSKVLRQSTQLLKFINSNGELDSISMKEVWLDKNSLERRANIGFPKYFIDTERVSSIKERDSNLESKMATLNTRSASEATVKVISLIKTDWFMQFLNRTLLTPYPVDRFTILVAIWIIGVNCRHRALEQLVCELVDQVYHEETNSSSNEDLMLLTQVGSIWLSYHKRHQTTMKQTNRQTAADELDEDSDPEDQVDDSSLDSSSIIDKGDYKTYVKPLAAAAAAHGHQLTDLWLKLRHLIDDELLHGGQCQICGHQPTDLLGPIKAIVSCSACGLNLAGVSIYCAISHRRLEILDLSSVLRLFSGSAPVKMVLLNQSEWVRELLVAKGYGMLPSGHDGGDDGDNELMGEQVDITEKFERLTMIRGGGGERRKLESGRSNSEHTEDDSLDSSNSSAEESDNQPTANNDDGNLQSETTNDYNYILRKFMKARTNYLPPLQAGNLNPPSESLMMIKFLRTNSGSARAQQQQQQQQWLPICSSDLLLLDTCGASLRLGIAESSRNLLAQGSIWQCSGRSTISGLLLGCGGTFYSMELIHLGQDPCLTGEFSCPSCGQYLCKIRTLAEALAEA